MKGGENIVYRNKLQQYIKSRGLAYLVGMPVSSGIFVVVSMMICVVCFFVLGFTSMDIWLRIILSMTGLFIPTIILEISNQSDNGAMLVDLKNIFELLKIQLHAGVYVIDALENCQENVKNKRLSVALKNLLNDIFLSKNITEALDDFGEHFSNHHIDTLVIILKQSMESGYSVNNLDNAFEEVLDVERAINIKIENSIERNVQILQVLLMSAIIAVSIYCSMIELKTLFEMH